MQVAQVVDVVSIARRCAQKGVFIPSLMLWSESVLPFFFPVNTRIPTGPAMNRCLDSSSSMTVCAFPRSLPPETSIMIPVPPVSSTEPPWKRRRVEHAMMQFCALKTNQIEPATKKRRDEGCVNKPRPAAIAKGAYCKICGYEGRLANCHFCNELGCKKCNYWCSEKKVVVG